MNQKRQIRNLGILAHVDAGKTTVTENMLFLSGSTRTLGDVNKGTTLSDGLDVEKKRGISVRASTFSFTWKDVQINLIDTPGHVDFSAEVERSLRVLDCAVLVLSAVEGIQAHTETIWYALQALNIPVIFFINKIDRMGANTQAVINKLKQEFSPDIILLNHAENEGDTHATTRPLTEEQLKEQTEKIAEKDDMLLEKYFNEAPITSDQLQTSLAQSVRNRHLFPVLCGVAKNNIGIEPLLDAIFQYFPNANTETDQPVSAVVYRLEHDPKLGRIAGIRLYRGQLKNRDIVHNITADREEKITQIKKPALNKFEDTGLIQAGDIGFVCGMPDVQIGDILGDPTPVPGNHTLNAPLLSVQVIPTNEADHTPLAEALQQLASEDPHLNFQWFPDERELHVKIMGAIQTEILTDILQTRFGIQATFGDPTVIYKETPSTTGYGTERYTMPKPCWAIVTYRIEPGELGSGITYHSEVATNDIKQKYQNEIIRNLPEAVHQGPRGWEVTDIKITLTEGSDHVLHSRPGNFRLATNIAILRGLTDIGTTLLEPFLTFRITAPEEFVGKVSSDIITMRGTLEPAEMADGRFTLKGRVPLATSLDYAMRLSSQTGGKATLSAHFDGYEPCADELGIIRPYKGICPLDRSKYILKMRGAITETVNK
jgi:ribosomal protection tetracycline resistance protein